MPIPKIIWQTHEYKNSELPPYLKASIGTWIENNPKFEHRYVSGANRRKFISENFEDTILKIYDACINGTIKADMWRVLVTHMFGGIYADIDTYCMRPINEFMDIQNQTFICENIGKIDKKEILINNAVFATVPRSDEISQIKNTIVDNGIRILSNNKPIGYGNIGPNIFTDVIKNMHGKKYIRALSLENEINSSMLKKIKPQGYQIESQESVIHVMGSKTWNDITEKISLEINIELLKKYITRDTDICITNIKR